MPVMEMRTEGPIKTRREGAILEVTLDAPKANAISLKTSRVMGLVFRDFRDDDSLRVCIIRAAGEKFFCPGWDLKAAAEGDAVDGDYGVGGFAGLQELPNLNKPVIAAVQGICCGGGLEFALSADLILCSTNATFALPEIRSGTVADAASIKLPKRIPYHVAMDLLLTGRWFDADRTAAHVLAASPAAVCQALVHLVGGRTPSDGWSGAWARAEAAAQGAIASALAEHVELTDPAVSRTVLGALPGDATLVVSSSMPVRDLEWFGAPRVAGRVLANRGANGIDGVISTAVGVALAVRGSDHRTVALVGDVAFLHDSNALLGLASRGVDLTIVVVDNDGGAIFSFLPQATGLPADLFEQLFGTPHGVDLSALVAAHGLDTIDPASTDDLVDAVRGSMLAGGVHVVRVTTDRAANVEVHHQIHQAVADALDTPG